MSRRIGEAQMRRPRIGRRKARARGSQNEAPALQSIASPRSVPASSRAARAKPETGAAIESESRATGVGSAPEAIKAEADRYYRAVGRDVNLRMARHNGEFRTSSRPPESESESTGPILLYASWPGVLD